MPPDAISERKMSQKCCCGRSSAANPAWGTYSAPQTPNCRELEKGKVEGEWKATKAKEMVGNGIKGVERAKEGKTGKREAWPIPHKILIRHQA